MFEVIDITDCERYYPIGIWLTERDADEYLKSFKEPITSDYHYPDDTYYVVEVRERAVGQMDEGGKTIAIYEWTGEYDEENDEAKWVGPKRIEAK